MKKIIDNKTNEKLKFIQKHSIIKNDYVLKYSSNKKGPIVIITGLVHGNEIVGLDVIYELYTKLQNKSIKLLKGKIYFILCNIKALNENVRFIDENMNRIFFDKNSASKSIEGKRVGEIKKIIKLIQKNNKGSKIYNIDMHSVSKGDFKICVLDKNDLKFRNMVKKSSNMKLFFYTDFNLFKGSLIGYLSKIGIKSFCIECGNHTSLNAKKVGVKEIKSFLKNLDMIRKLQLKLSIFKKIREYEFEEIIKAYKGLVLNKNILTETFVKEGEIIGTYEKNKKYVSPKDYYILMPSKVVDEKDSDAGFFCNKL